MARTTLQVDDEVSNNIDILCPHLAKRLNVDYLTKKQAVAVLVNQEMQKLGLKPKKKEVLA